MASSLVRTFGNTSDAKPHREDEGFGLWREVDRVFDNLARGFGRENRNEMVRGGFAGEVLAPQDEIAEVPLNREGPAPRRLHNEEMPLPRAPQQARSEVLAPSHAPAPTPATPTPIRLRSAAPTNNGAINPVTDAWEDDDCFEVIVELPGIKEAEIDIEFSDGALTISAERKRETETDEKRHHVRERTYGTFRRRLTLPFQANPDIITASYADGVVTVTVPRPPETKPRTKKIGVKRS
jgi:HSP20 family protein